MKVTVIGTGYVGLVTGACLAEVGNEVFCLDLDERKVERLDAGHIPIYEPGLEAIVQRNHAAGRLRFSSDIAASVEHGEIQFIAVGTPSAADGSADLSHVLAAARNIGRHMTGFKVVVDKSTVPVGTGDKVRAVIGEEIAARRAAGEAPPAPAIAAERLVSVVSNPEFLKEGAAVEDFMRPDRIVIGADDDAAGQLALQLMRGLFAPFNRHHERIVVMGVRSAEFTKYAANAMLATRISFMNELANLADKVGADIESVRRGIGSDPRIGYDFLYAGTGYGGSCFPKDVKALNSRPARARRRGCNLLSAVEAVNEVQKRVLVEKIVHRFGPDLSGLTFAVWGLAFKPNTDDMREAPSRVVIAGLASRGATLRLYDPVAMAEARHSLEADLAEASLPIAHLVFCESQSDALRGADALVIVTEWKSFRSPDFAAMRSLLKQAVIFDGRNLFEPADVKDGGFEYFGVGRSA